MVHLATGYKESRVDNRLFLVRDGRLFWRRGRGGRRGRELPKSRRGYIEMRWDKVPNTTLRIGTGLDGPAGEDDGSKPDEGIVQSFASNWSMRKKSLIHFQDEHGLYTDRRSQFGSQVIHQN